MSESSESKPVIETPFFEVPFEGEFSRDQVIIEDDPQVTDLPEEVMGKVESAWQKKTAEVAARGGTIFDNTIVTLRGWDVRDGKLFLKLGRTTYKNLVAFVFDNDHPLKLDYPNLSPNSLASSTLVETSDGYLALNERSQTVSHYPGWIGLYGGVADLTQIDDQGRVNPFVTAEKEIEEESHIPPETLVNIKALGFSRDLATGLNEMIFSASTSLTKAEIETKQKGQGLEEGGTIFVPATAEDLRKKVLEYSKITTTDALAPLVLYGRKKFGEEWFGFVIQRLKRRGEVYTQKLDAEKRKLLEQKLVARLSRGN